MKNKKSFKFISWLIIFLVVLGFLFWKNFSKNKTENQSGSDQNSSSKIVKKGEEIELRSNDFVDCSNSNNSETTKEFTIDVATQNDDDKYQAKKKEIVGVINQCYSVVLKEAYEPQAGEIAYQQVEFKNKMRTDSDIFSNLPFYSGFNLNTYEGFLENGLDYVTTDAPEKVVEFYLNAKLKNENFKLDETQKTESSLAWKSTRFENESIKMEVMGFENATLVKFDYLRQFDYDPDVKQNDKKDETNKNAASESAKLESSEEIIVE